MCMISFGNRQMQILRSAQDDMAGGIFRGLLVRRQTFLVDRQLERRLSNHGTDGFQADLSQRRYAVGSGCDALTDVLSRQVGPEGSA
jgi:hypothetical protein